MNKILSFLKSTKSWLILLPLFLVLAGAASNQAVLIANHGKFPVMLNERQLASFQSATDLRDANANANQAAEASEDAAALATKYPQNKAVKEDADVADRSSKTAIKSYARALSAFRLRDFDTVKAEDAKSKIARDAAVAAEDKAELDSKDVAKPAPDAVEKAKRQTPRKNFSILNTSVHMNDVNGQFLDDVHSVMGPNSRLKALADVFDLGSIYSIGDFGIMVGMYFWPFLTLLFIALNLRRVNDLQNLANVLIGVDVLLTSYELLSFEVVVVLLLLAFVGGFAFVAHKLGKGFSEIKAD